MLNPFPELLTYSFAAPFLIRVTLGIILLFFGWDLLKKTKSFVLWLFIALSFLAGASLLIGFYAQIGAILGAILGFLLIFFKKSMPEIAHCSTACYALMIAISFSILISGAGAFAFDLPL